MSCHRGGGLLPHGGFGVATPRPQDSGYAEDGKDSAPSLSTAWYLEWLLLNIHFHMLFLDGVYVERPDGTLRFRWVKAPTSAELTRLTQTLALRVGRYLERQGLLERDAENSYLAGDDLKAGPMEQLLGSSITYRIAVGPQQGRKVFTLQTLPACDEPFDDGVGKVAGFSLHAGVAARADQRQKLERLQPNYIIFRTRTVAFDGDDHPRRASLAWRDGGRVASVWRQRGVHRA